MHCFREPRRPRPDLGHVDRFENRAVRPNVINTDRNDLRPAGECLKTIFAEGNPPVSSVRYSPNGRFILVNTLDDTIRLWNASNPSRCVKTYRGHHNRRFCVFSAFSVTHGKYIVSGSEDNSVYLWDLQDRSVIQRLSGHTDAVLSVSCHPTRNTIASGGSSNDKMVRLWEQGGAE